MVLLRIAIGWHLFYEGVTKILSHPNHSCPIVSETRRWMLRVLPFSAPGGSRDKAPFSSEGYLRNASGPFRRQFRELVDDYWGLDRLNESALTERWRADVNRLDRALGLSIDEKRPLDAKLKSVAGQLHEYLNAPENKKKISEYQQQVTAWTSAEGADVPSFEQDEQRKRLRDLDAKRRELVGPIDAWNRDLLDAFDKAVEGKDLDLWKRTVLWWEASNTRERVDVVTMVQLTVAGFLLMIGLFTRLAALAGAVLLALFYFSAPPWPGLPPAPNAEGTYLYVNKNLIELIACLMLATTSSGAWGGVDSLIRGLITRPLFGVGADEVRERAVGRRG